MPSFGFGFGSAMPRSEGTGYDPAATAFFARATTQPTLARKRLLSNFFKAIRAAGLIGVLDALYLMAAADSQIASLNLLASTFTLNPVNAPIFTADQGYAGDGVSSYVDSTFNPTTAPTPHFAQDNAYFGIWSRTAAQAAASVAGFVSAPNGTLLLPRGTTDLFSGRLNGGLNLTASETNGAGFFSVTRGAPATENISANGASVASGVPTSTAISNGSFAFGTANHTGFTATQFAAGAIGGAPTPTQDAALYAALQTYLHAIGAA